MRDIILKHLTDALMDSPTYADILGGHVDPIRCDREMRDRYATLPDRILLSLYRRTIQGSDPVVLHYDAARGYADVKIGTLIGAMTNDGTIHT